MPRFYFLQTYCEQTLGRPSNKTKCVSNDRSGHDDSNGPRIVKIGAILAIFRPFEVLVPWTSLCGAQKIWTSIFCFQETGVLEELGGFERHWDVRRKNLLPVVRLFLGRVPWRRGKQGDLCFFGGFGTQNDFNHLDSTLDSTLDLTSDFTLDSIFLRC